MDHGHQYGLRWEHEPWKSFEEAKSKKQTVFVRLRYLVVAQVVAHHIAQTVLHANTRHWSGSRFMVNVGLLLRYPVSAQLQKAGQHIWEQDLSKRQATAYFPALSNGLPGSPGMIREAMQTCPLLRTAE